MGYTGVTEEDSMELPEQTIDDLLRRLRRIEDIGDHPATSDEIQSHPPGLSYAGIATS